jgi:hypothetical protein
MSNRNLSKQTVKPKALNIIDNLTPLSSESSEFSIIKEKTQIQLENLKKISETTKILCSKRTPPSLHKQVHGYFVETLQTQPTVKVTPVKKEEKLITKETDELFN